jgi:integrase
MPVHRRKYISGKTVWFYRFNIPGLTRDTRREIREFGFETKQAAIDAEAQRRVDEQQKYDLRKAGAVGVAAALPTTLGMLLQEFFRQHAEENLAPKTRERYKELAKYLAPELLAMPPKEVTPLHFNREWARLLKCGGHTRKSGTPRPMSAKTVRNIAGVVSSAFGRGIKWGLVSANPVTNSEPPRAKKHRGIALTPAQQKMVIDAATSPWCMRTFLEVVAGTGCRRGEVLALRWSDIQDGRAMVARSLTQTRDVLEFKGTKQENPRSVSLPTSAIAALNAHRNRQGEFRCQFGPNYRADLDLIFANPDGTPLKPDSISAAVSLLFRRVKLPKSASLHSLRHTHTSHLLASGVPLPAISARLGHQSIRTTQEIYAHMIHGQDDEAAQKWEEFQNQPLVGASRQTGKVQ